MTRGIQAGLRFRTRKLSPKQPLPVLREDQIDSDEYKELLENQYKVETGVEKSEENEYHLQEALAAALGRGNQEEAKKIVPAPPAQESKDINYDELYSMDFPKSSTYIRFSQTVEECTGCRYDMTTDDDIYLKSYNAKRPVSSQCSEDDFEKMMEVFESTADHQAPFAAVDNTVIDYETMEFPLKQEVDEKTQVYAKDIHEYWKMRRQCSGNKPLQPSLKFEIHQDSDDGDPYVCFRRRDVRQTRKTRARDVQSNEKLRRLRKELEEGRQLVAMAHQRELAKREQIAIDRLIFEQRTKVKDVRQRLGVKVDDEDLINQKPQKRKPTDVSQLQRPQGTQLRMPARPDGRPIETDMTLLIDVLAQKENLLQMEIESKIQQHQRWNQNYVDVTREPLSPVRDQVSHSSFRLATAQYLMTPPASVASDSSGDQPSPVQDNDDHDGGFRFATPPEDTESQGEILYRRRVGRLGRLWIDRRGFSTPTKDMNGGPCDRWKYDMDDDEQPIYEVDPYDTKAIKFRATIPYAGVHSRRTQQEVAALNNQPANNTTASPPNRSQNSTVSAQQPT